MEETPTPSAPAAEARPRLGVPHGLEEIQRVYGDIQVRGGAIVGPPGWESQHMHTVVDLPGWGRRLYIHRAIEAPLREALAAAVATGWAPMKLSCFNPRFKRGVDGELSVHSWGCAVDVDPDANPLVVGCPPGDPRRVKALPDQVIDAFKGAGWVWGGDWAHRWDPMHFQLASGY